MSEIAIIFINDDAEEAEEHERHNWPHIPRVGDLVDLFPTCQRDPLQVVSVIWRDHNLLVKDGSSLVPFVTVHLRRIPE